MTDVGLVYGACCERISELVRDLDDARAAPRVRAASDWSIHDVVAHLVGIVAEINAGKADGVVGHGDPAATVTAEPYVARFTADGPAEPLPT